jgi:hypothetical protein
MGGALRAPPDSEKQTLLWSQSGGCMQVERVRKAVPTT